MLHTIKSLLGFKMAATDGNIGELKEFYFDDEIWIIRYLIIETGNWLSNKKVLIAPQALLAPDWANKSFPVRLTKAQVKSSPDIDTDQPVSHRQEIEMFRHYAWEHYGGSGIYGGGSAMEMKFPPIEEGIITSKDSENKDNDYVTHLRSTERISGYHIHATDGNIGHVKDFIIDTDKWIVSDLVVDTHDWIGEHKVLIPVRHVKEIQWENFKVIVDISKEYLKDCEVVDENRLVFPQNIFEL